jgi:hypothetical protein
MDPYMRRTRRGCHSYTRETTDVASEVVTAILALFAVAGIADGSRIAKPLNGGLFVENDLHADAL